MCGQASMRWKRIAKAAQTLRRRRLKLGKLVGRTEDHGGNQESTANHCDQEKGRSRWAPRGSVEGGVCRLCDGNDVAVYRAVADGFKREGEEGGGRLL